MFVELICVGAFVVVGFLCKCSFMSLQLVDSVDFV